MAAAKTFETSFKIGAKYTGEAEVRKANRGIDSIERNVKGLRDTLKRARTHFFDFGKVAAGAFAGFTAAGLIGGAIRGMKSLTTAAFDAADSVIKLREENKRLLQSYGLSKKEAEATEKRLYGVAQAMQAAAGGGHDAELMSKALVGLRKSLDEKTIIAHKEAIAGYATLLANGAIPAIEHFQQVQDDMNKAILLGKSPIFQSLGWTNKQIKVFKEYSRAERERVLLAEMERKGWNKLTKEFYDTDTGKMIYASTVWGDLLETLGEASAAHKGKIGQLLIDLAKGFEPIAKELGRLMGKKLGQWLNEINRNLPDIIKNINIWWERLKKLAEIIDWTRGIWMKVFGVMFTGLGKTIDLIIAVWETLHGKWGAIPKWFDENVIKPLAALWDWLIGNSYMVEGAERGWNKIKEIWKLWADWFWVHVVKPISDMWGGLTKAGGPFLGGGGTFRGHGATGSWGDSGAGDGGVTSAGGGALGTTGPNAEIAAERAAVMEELKDPATRKLVAATLAQEMGSTSGRADVLESLVNRAVVKKKSLRSLITGGFYGPYNRGQVKRALRRGMSQAAMDEFDAIAKEVAAGRNRIKGRVDQGRPREVARRGRITSEGEAYGFWNMARESNTAAFRAGQRGAPTPKASDQQAQATKVVREPPKKSSTPYNPINPYSGQPGLRGPEVLSPSASLRGMLQPLNMRGRMGGQAPQNVTMNSPINFNGSTSATPDEIAAKVGAVLRNSSREVIATMKRARADEQRLNFDFA